MLATCVVNGWPTDGYLDPRPPRCSVAITRIESLGATVHHVGVDGCGAPTHALSLRDLAGAFAALAARLGGRAGDDGPSDHGRRAERDVTLWMQAVPTLVAKEGAAGVMAVGLADGRAARVQDRRRVRPARRAVVAEALRAVGIDVDVTAQ
jgi:L-asparaginase II